jgi:hypothetical protein
MPSHKPKPKKVVDIEPPEVAKATPLEFDDTNHEPEELPTIEPPDSFTAVVAESLFFAFLAVVVLSSVVLVALIIIVSADCKDSSLYGKVWTPTELRSLHAQFYANHTCCTAGNLHLEATGALPLMRLAHRVLTTLYLDRLPASIPGTIWHVAKSIIFLLTGLWFLVKLGLEWGGTYIVIIALIVIPVRLLYTSLKSSGPPPKGRAKKA